MNTYLKLFVAGPNKSSCLMSSDKPLYLLSCYISSEVQQSKQYCIEQLQIINDIKSGKLEEYDTDYGNECRAVIRKDGVTIDLYHDMDNPVTYPLPVFKKALEEWLDFLETGRERTVTFEDF